MDEFINTWNSIKAFNFEYGSMARNQKYLWNNQFETAKEKILDKA